MRFRMLNRPEIIELINQETVPVRLNVSREPFPDVPAMRQWEREYRLSPWARMIYAHFVLMAPDGSRLYGSLSCQCIELMEVGSPYVYAERDLRHYIDNYRRSSALRKKAASDPAAAAELVELDATVDAELAAGRVCVSDPRFQAGRFLADFGASKWDKVMALVRPPTKGEVDQLSPGLRALFIRRLGEFVSDDSPFAAATQGHLKVLYSLIPEEERQALLIEVVKRKAARGDTTELSTEDFIIPHSLRRRAALSISEIKDLGWSSNDADLIAKGRAWWTQHAGDPEYADEAAFAIDHALHGEMK